MTVRIEDSVSFFNQCIKLENENNILSQKIPLLQHLREKLVNIKK